MRGGVLEQAGLAGCGGAHDEDVDVVALALTVGMGHAHVDFPDILADGDVLAIV